MRAFTFYKSVFSPAEELRNSLKKEGIICPKPFVVISSVGKPLNTVLSQQRKMGKASDFPPQWYIAFSPHDIQITLFFNLDKSRQPVLVAEVNSQS